MTRGTAGRRRQGGRQLAYERRSEPLLDSRAFVLRLARHLGIAAAVVTLSLAAGAVGYRVTEGMPWLDAVLNAAMILTGMGPVDVLHSNAGKLFATGYAIFSGVVFLGVAGLVLAPALHRLLHRFHLDDEQEPS